MKPLDQLKHSLDELQIKNKSLNAFISIDPEKSLQDYSRENISPPDPSLNGVLVGIKDNIAVKNWPLTCASKILSGYESPYDAHVVTQLKNAGAIVAGKTNLDEFGMGSTNEYSAFGPVLNPIDQTRVAGGSSGGSAAAVAAGLVPVALGSDTGGSVRLPASFCGVVGFKPSYGRISRFGLVAYASSLDQIGILAPTVKAVASVFDVVSSPDIRDATNARMPASNSCKLLGSMKNLAGKKIGFITNLLNDGVSKEVAGAIVANKKIFRDLGAEVVEIDVPTLKFAASIYYVIAAAEASANLARYDGIRYGFRSTQKPESRTEESELETLYRHSRSLGFGDEVKKRILLGTFVLSAGYYDSYYGKATRVRALLAKEIAHIFGQVDFLVCPSSVDTAYKLGEKSKDAVSLYKGDLCTVLANLVGLPAISIPAGHDSLGLPIGMQIIGRRWDDERLLVLSDLIEKNPI